MRTLKTGEPCPCCGQPIPLTDPTDLLLLTCECVLMGLLDDEWLRNEDEEENDDDYRRDRAKADLLRIRRRDTVCR